MHWYYDNEGTAEGPHDDEVMAAYLKEGRVTLKTLIWQPELETWAEVGVTKPVWAEKASKPKSKTASVLSKLTGGIPAQKPASPKAQSAEEGADRRSPTPLAPSGPAQDSAKGEGMLKRLFKFGRKKN